jgi:hypothetical protein
MGVQVEDQQLIPVYERIEAGLNLMGGVLRSIEAKLDVRRRVTTTSARVVFVSYMVSSNGVRVQVPDQIRLTISNQGANPVYLAAERMVTADDASYELDETDPPLVLETAGEVWIFALNANVERVDIIAEMG